MNGKIKSQQLQATQFILLQETYPLEQRENSETITNKFSALSYSIKTLGGAYGYSISTPL